MYPPYEREKSRERSRDRDKKGYTRSPSEDDKRQRHSQFRDTKTTASKRVKFEEGKSDIRVFRKEDQPTAKGLNEEEIQQLKVELEKEIAKYDLNWEHFKHRDALSESRDMREQREKERVLSEKLMAARETIAYACPVPLRKDEKSLVEWGVESEERQAHTNRIHDILGCYYTSLSEIPNQPSFQILNSNSTSECRIIKFEHDTPTPDTTYNTSRTTPDQKPLKGILKMPASAVEKPPLQPKNINPQLILLLNDMKKNPGAYTREKTDQLLKPFKESGELEYLTKNKDVLQSMIMKMSSQASMSRPSASRDSQDRPMMPPTFTHSYVPKADKFRTVPCKYYHSHLGCNKIDNCTYIHDERYKGVAVPPNYVPPTQSKVQPSFKGYPPMSPGGVSNLLPTPSQPYANSGYYNNNNQKPYQADRNYSNYPDNRYPANMNYQNYGERNNTAENTSGYSQERGQQNYSQERQAYNSQERGQTGYIQERGQQSYSQERGQPQVYSQDRQVYNQERGQQGYPPERGQQGYTQDRGQVYSQGQQGYGGQVVGQGYPDRNNAYQNRGGQQGYGQRGQNYSAPSSGYSSYGNYPNYYNYQNKNNPNFYPNNYK